MQAPNIELIDGEDVQYIGVNQERNTNWHEGDRVALADGRAGWFVGFGPHWSELVFEYWVRIDRRTHKRKEA